MLHQIPTVQKNWGQASVVFDASQSETFKVLSKYNDIRYFLAPEDPMRRLPMPRIQVTRSRGDGSLAVTNNATVDEAISALQGGAAIGIQNVSEYNSEIANLCADYYRSIPCAGEVFTNVYVSAPGSSVAAHLDPEHVFFVQLSGSRTWSFGKAPSADNPLTSLAASWVDARNRLPTTKIPYDPKRFDRSEAVSCVLNAGDCLYLPPGCWHKPMNDGDAHSLHVTLSVRPLTMYDLLMQNLKLRSLEDSSLRAELSRETLRDEVYQEAVSKAYPSSAFKALTNRNRIGLYSKTVRRSFWNP